MEGILDNPNKMSVCGEQLKIGWDMDSEKCVSNWQVLSVYVLCVEVPREVCGAGSNVRNSSSRDMIWQQARNNK